MREIREIKWSGEEIRTFLNTYRIHPCLWDNSSPYYLNRDVKRVAFHNLLTKLHELGLPIEEDQLRKKIKSIRDTYRAELNKVIKSIQTGIGYYPKLCWYSTADAFLNGPVTGRQSASILDSSPTISQQASQSNTESEEALDAQIPKEEHEDEEPAFIDDPETPFTEAVSTSHIEDYADEFLQGSPSSSLFPTTSDRKRNSDEISTGPQLAKNAKIAKCVASEDSHMEDDDIGEIFTKAGEDQYDIFAKHVATQLRQLPTRSFVLLQARMQELITKERLKYLDVSNVP